MVLLIGIYSNYKISSLSAELNRLYMQKQDLRMNLTTECLTNIKIIKIYGWTERFLEMIYDARMQELSILTGRFRLAVGLFTIE